MSCKSVRPTCAESNPIHSDPGTTARDRAAVPVSTGLFFSPTPAWTWSQVTQRSYPAATQAKIRQLATSISFLDQVHNEPHDAPLSGTVSSFQRIHDADNRQAYSEHMGQRSQSVAAMAALRETIKTLTPDALQLPIDQFHALKIFLNQKANDLAPYYTQMGNINLLAGEGHRAWRRTCNVTSLSMALEGLGVGPVNFHGDIVLLQRISAALEPWRYAQELLEDKRIARLKDEANKRNAKAKGKAKRNVASIPSEDDWGMCYSGLDSLRMPDFVQHIAVYVMFTQPHGSGKKKRHYRTEPEKAFLEDVLAARQEASAAILSPDTLVAIAKQFEGVEASFAYTKFGDYAVLDRDLKQVQQKENDLVRDQLNAFQKETKQTLVKGSEEEKREVEAIRSRKDFKTLQEKEKEDKAKMAPFESEMDKNIREYRKFVETVIVPKTEDGAQIIVNRPGHFMKLHSVEPSGLVVDDPATRGKRHRVNWSQAYHEGYFRDYVILTR